MKAKANRLKDEPTTVILKKPPDNPVDKRTTDDCD